MSGSIDGAARIWGSTALRACENERKRLRDLDEEQVAEIIRLSFEAGARWGRTHPGDPNE